MWRYEAARMITQCCLAAACFGFPRSCGFRQGREGALPSRNPNTKHHVRQRLPTSIPAILREFIHIRLPAVNIFNTKLA